MAGKSRSPYATYKKAPYQYSEYYRRWSQAADEPTRAEADRRFREVFQIPVKGAFVPIRGAARAKAA